MGNNRILIPLLLSLLACAARAEVKLPSLISDGMVLQRRQNVRLWGTADAGERFNVTFRKKTYEVTADADGRWMMTLPPQKEGGPFTLTIGDKTVSNVMVGDVWICSGQSNVDLQVERVEELYKEEVSTARNAAVRLLMVDMVADVHRQHEDVKTSGWHELEPQYARNFSALAYFLAKLMQEKTGVPQGVIASSWGGTPIQAWMPADSSAWQSTRREELLLAQNDEYTHSLRNTERAYSRWWSALLYASDPGKRGKGWQSDDTDESEWQQVNVEKDEWGKAGGGSWWLRQHINIDKNHAGKPATLRLGMLVDADSTYVNGQFVGVTHYQYPPRKYHIPEGLLREGDNIITVRITTGRLAPKFVYPKPYLIDFGNDDTQVLSNKWLMRRGAALKSRKSYELNAQYIASACYNSMLYPLRNYTIGGAVWYQGESNTHEAAVYRRLLVSLMSNWREIWNNPTLPFYIVQLPDFMDSGTEPEESGWVDIREAQRLATTDVTNATIVTGLGLGERHDIHPIRKRELAERVVAEILGEGAPKVVRMEGNTVTFSAPLQEGEVNGFELSADGKKFFNAKAVAKGNSVNVTCQDVPSPIAARYAWQNSPDGANLKGRNGQPVATFQQNITRSSDDGSKAWLTMPTNANAKITCKPKDQTAQIAAKELRQAWLGQPVTLRLSKDKTLGKEGYRLSFTGKAIIVEATTSQGLLYAAYDLLRKQALNDGLCQGKDTAHIVEKPALPLRMLNHWDNLDGTVERGYAGNSIFWGKNRIDAASITATDRRKWTEYARLCASIGINATVLNNVNASPKALSTEVLGRVKEIADALRPYGITTYLSINFSSPSTLGKLKNSDPFDPAVRQWWKDKADEIYELIPDFGGFLVKANSEGQPGPQNYGRTHADGANMLAEALQPHGGKVIWRAFVYSAESDDRAKQAYDEFKPLDGKFADGVAIQVKNGPIDFQPLEPYSPLFGQMARTPLTAELQITMEYLGQDKWLTFLAPQWKHFLDECGQAQDSKAFNAIAGVSNIGDDKNWCGSIFNQANFYAFGRLAWNPAISPKVIAEEWTAQTLFHEKRDTTEAHQQARKAIVDMMLGSWRNTLNVMMPLGLHHIFAANHHYGPEPWCNPPGWRKDWTPPYYHKADKDGIGFDRTAATGTAATQQYPKAFAEKVERLETCPDDYLLWFHHLPWNYRMRNGNTLWKEMCHRYNTGLNAISEYPSIWQQTAPFIAPKIHESVKSRLNQQLRDATVWRDTCIDYFQSINQQPTVTF